MRSYAEHFDEFYKDGCGAIIHGDVGVGKSFAAACVANELTDRGYTCYMTNFARIINTIFGLSSEKQRYIDNLNQYDLLVIDDFGMERDTPYAMEIETQVIDARCRCGKPLIITTNLTAEELCNPTGIQKKRIYSRLREMCLDYHYDGVDRRNHKMMMLYNKYKDLL